MNAIILSIGDELVLGQSLDTNSQWLSQQLAAVGCDISGHMTVADDQKAIEIAIRSSAGHFDVLIISGGLGPTEDDLTRQALAAVMGAELEMNDQWLSELKGFFEKRGRAMPERNKIQAMIPCGAKMIFNTCGTAAGIEAVVEGYVPNDKYSALASDEQLDRLFGKVGALETKIDRLLSKRPTRVFVVPGVPSEMKAMFTRDILPIIKAKSGGAVILSRTLHTIGLGESAVAERLGDLMNRSRNPSVGTTVANGIVSLRVNSRFGSREEAQKELDATSALCRAALGDLIYGENDQTLPQVVAEQLLATPNTSVATAESCTGGLLAKYLTDVSGSSAYFKFGWVTYANQAKTQLLGVPQSLLESQGAVSEPVVKSMATNARDKSGATYALAISGVAGPTGGTPEKPVGTVWIALASFSGAHARVFNFPGDREFIRDRAAKMALSMLRYHLIGKPMPF